MDRRQFTVAAAALGASAAAGAALPAVADDGATATTAPTDTPRPDTPEGSSMKLLLIGIDGIRLDVAVPSALSTSPSFAHPDHPSDPQYSADRDPADEPEMTPPSTPPAAPALAGLLERGAIVPVWMTPPTMSGPGWASLLTGATHAEHNVWDNDFADHHLDRTPDVLSRLHAAEPSARTLAAASWAPIVDPEGPGPIIAERPADQAAGRHRTIPATDDSDGSVSADDQVCDLVVEALREDGLEGTFVHLDAVDEAGHATGAASPEYPAAISGVDALVGRLVQTVEQRAEQHQESWLVAVVTDHGHTPEGGHGQDETEVRRSFLLARGIGPGHAQGAIRKLSRRGPLRSQQVTPLLLDLLGATPAG